jgi:carbamate kinase
VRRHARYAGIEAVIDKDRVSSLLAIRLKADVLIFSTGVERVAWHFGRPDQRFLERLTSPQARAFLEQGEFPPGSMGPKIEAAVEFLAAGGRRAVITSPENIARAVQGEAGTEILAPVETPEQTAVA